MSNPFNNYTPTIKVEDISAWNKISRTKSAQRAKAMASDDPAKVKAAKGTIYELVPKEGKEKKGKKKGKKK